MANLSLCDCLLSRLPDYEACDFVLLSSTLRLLSGNDQGETMGAQCEPVKSERTQREREPSQSTLKERERTRIRSSARTLALYRYVSPPTSRPIANVRGRFRYHTKKANFCFSFSTSRTQLELTKRLLCQDQRIKIDL